MLTALKFCLDIWCKKVNVKQNFKAVTIPVSVLYEVIHGLLTNKHENKNYWHFPAVRTAPSVHSTCCTNRVFLKKTIYTCLGYTWYPLYPWYPTFSDIPVTLDIPAILDMPDILAIFGVLDINHILDILLPLIFLLSLLFFCYP